MNRLQRLALINLSLAIVGLLLQIVDLFLPRGSVSRLVFSILILIIMVPLIVCYFYRRKLAKQGGQLYDERDATIAQTALIVGLMSMFLVVFLVILVTFIGLGPGSSVEIGMLFDIFLLGAISLYIGESLTIIVKYGWGKTGEQL